MPEHPSQLSRHHVRIRSRGVNPWVYWPVRWVLKPLILIWFRLTRQATHHIPSEGPVLLAANHRSFLDPFAIGCCIRRPIYFVAKRELFDNRLIGWFLNALGAFPIRRGESDEEAMRTAREVLERGDAVVIFPEGTRHRTGSLGRPKRGVGRLALEAAAPVVPIAIIGSERARRGYLIRPVKVAIRCGSPLTFPRVEDPSAHLAGEVTARIWPCVQLQWEWLGGLPALRKAAVVGAGSMGTAVAELLARSGMEVELGCRTAAQAAEVASSRTNERYLPGIRLDDRVTVRTAAEIELAGVDLLVLAVPSRDLPGAVARTADRVGPRTAVLVLTKGVVAPLGTLPSRYVADRMRSRAVAALLGPTHAAETLERGASAVVATEDPHLSRQLRDALSTAGIDIEETDDVIGAELAACAKNLASLAAAAAAPTGLNIAGAAAGRVFGEIHDFAVASGGRAETFAGLAGVGDLVATALAEGSRNRRAGELLGRGVSAEEAGALVGQAAEALDFAPLLAEAMGPSAVAVGALGALVEGRLTPDQWLAGAAGARRAA